MRLEVHVMEYTISLSKLMSWAESALMRGDNMRYNYLMAVHAERTA